MKTKKIKIIIISIIISIITLIGVVYAATSYRVNNGATVTVDEHTVCNKVVNAGGVDYFVPTNTATEWTAFRNNLPSGVTLDSCVVTFPDPNCTAVTIPSGYSLIDLNSTANFNTSCTNWVVCLKDEFGGVLSFNVNPAPVTGGTTSTIFSFQDYSQQDEWDITVQSSDKTTGFGYVTDNNTYGDNFGVEILGIAEKCN